MSINDTPWYVEEGGFFGPGYLLEYEGVLPHERTLREVDFLLKELRPNKDASILDMPCGHGRHSIELAKRGYDVVGVDLNMFFLRKAKESALAAQVHPEFRQGDMRKIPYEKFERNLGEGFDIALNMFTAIGYFEDDADDQKVFNTFYASLKSGGVFFLDFLNRDRLMRNFRSQDWRELSDGSIILIERTHNMLTGRNTDRRLTIYPDGSRKDLSGMTCRMYSAVELIKMGETAGFRLRDSYGDFDGSHLSTDSPRVLLVFEKL